MEPIVEIGSFIVQGQEELANLRPIFAGKKFIGCDMRNGNGVDRIENIESLAFADESIGTILILDTLEHIQNCFKAFDEIHRVMKNEGTVIMSSVMNFPIHDYPSDYWRFTPEAFKFLLNKFPVKIIGIQGNPDHPHTVLAVGIKSNDFSKFEKILNDLKSNYKVNPPQSMPEKIKSAYFSAQTIMKGLFDKKKPVFKIYNHEEEKS
ncbi:MAG: class I SAM-dependent methyltransferase [Firmicutes bacterium]|nr:class I SAM-dependent methyltransferase [Bacillota bacterium]